MEANNEKREKLKEFYYSIKNCCSCELCNTRINFVFGSGNANASILLIGEAPGRNEDLQGKPFVGQAGKLLDDLLEGIGLTRNEVFIANVLKCRPPANRDPALTEINTCKQYLFEQIEIIDPAIICTMGRYSTQLVLNTTEGITKLRGNIFKINGRLILPINHPAAALYAPSRMQILKEDFNRIKSVLDKSVHGKSYDAGEVLETAKISEIGAVKNPVFTGKNKSSLSYTEQQQDASIYNGGRVDRDKMAGVAGREDPDKQTGPADRDGSEGNSAGVDESGTASGQNVISDKTQAAKNQQLGLF